VQPTFASFTVSVTPNFGNPNLFARVGTLNPATPQYSSSSSMGIDFITIGRNDTIVATGCTSWPANPCTFFFWVTAGTRLANYTISVNDGSASTQLIANVPAIGSLNANSTVQTAAYSFAVPLGATFATFILAPLGNNGPRSVPLLAVSITNANNVTTYCAQSNDAATRSGIEVIVLTPASTTCWCTNCTYFITVTVRNTPGALQVQPFALTASLQANPVRQLFDGISLSGDASNGLGPGAIPIFVFNAFFDNFTARNLRIIESPLVGAMQLYVTLDGSSPSPSNFAYSSLRFSGQNEIVVRVRDPAVQQFCAPANAANMSCPVQIAIYATTVRASFAIVATLAAVQELVPGQPINDYAWANRVTSYFMPDINFNGTAIFTVTPLSSQFVNIYVGSDQVPGTRVGIPGNASSYCYTNVGNVGSPAAITIPPTDPCFCQALPCNYYVSIGGFPNNTVDYTVLGRYAGGFSVLQLNVPVTDVLPPSAQTTSINNYWINYPEAIGGSRPADSLTFNVDSVPNAGRLSLFASVCAIGINCPPSGPFIGPNPGQFQWQFRMSTGMQNAQVVISATDPLFIANCQQYIVPGLPYNSSCVAQVAVRADPTVPVPAVYTITAFAAARQLVDGQVVQAISQTNQLTYFRYTVVDLRRPLKITVAALAGDPDLFVGIGMIPNATSFSFTSTTPGVEVISITWDSPAVVRMIPPGGVPFDVLIGVLGNDGPAVYNIDATSNGIVQLRDGATVGGSAGPLGFAYYFFTIPANQTQRTGFRVSVTAVAGPQPFILVNTPNRPGPNGFPLLPRCAQTTCDGTGFTNFAITSANSLSPTFVEVDPDSQFYSAGIFAIGIFATEFTTFQITASSLNSIITVGDGIPYNGFLILSNYTFFVLPIFSVFSAMSITLDTTGGLPVGVDIFASTNSTIRRPRLANCGNQNQNAPCPLGVPGIFASTTMFTRPTAELLISASNISAPSGAACNILPCSLYFSITETNNRYIGNISYTITARTIGNSSRTLLPVGQPLFGRLPSLGIAYYYGEMVNVNRSSFSVTITLSPVALTTALYVTLDGSQPGPGNSVYNSTTSSGVNYVSIPRSVIVAAAVNGNVVINMAVNTPSHPSQTAQYWIAWTNTDPNVVNQLVAGVPAVGVLFGRTFAYYYFTAPALNAFSDVTLSLTNNAGDSSLFLSRWSDVGNNTAFRPGPVPISTNCANSTNDGADWIIIPSAGASPFPSPAGVPYAQACRCTSYPCNYIVAVYCAVSARCQFSLTVTLGDTTPLLLPEGQALTLPLIPARNIYYYYDMRDAIANGRNMTIIAPAVGGSLPNVFLYATSTFLPGITDPSLLPVAASAGTYIWSSNAAGVPPSSSPTITISPTDPAFATCNATSGCPFITFGVSSDMATGTSTARPQWFSAGGVPQQVALGSTSAVQGLAAGSSRTFVMTLSTTQRNLIVFATLTFGNVGFTISNSNPQTTCTVPPPPGPPGAYTCDGTWATVANPGFSGPSQIIVAASNPCANSNPNARPACSNQTAWATGPYWITVYAISDARFTLSTGLVGVPQVLTDGIPAQTTTDNINQPLFDFRTASRASTTNFPVALYITATTNALNVYVNSCRDGVCTPQNQLPVPGSAMATVTVPAGATQVVTFSVGQNAYCAQLQGSFCHYYVAITPQTSCDPRAGCSAATTIMGTVQTGTAPVPVAFNQIQNTVAATNGVLPATGNQLYEVYLDPALGASTVFLVLDSCGPGYPAMVRPVVVEPRRTSSHSHATPLPRPRFAVRLQPRHARVRPGQLRALTRPRLL
jgi:hypothetical protein